MLPFLKIYNFLLLYVHLFLRIEVIYKQIPNFYYDMIFGYIQENIWLSVVNIGLLIIIFIITCI